MYQLIAIVLLVAALIGGAQVYVHGKEEKAKAEVRAEQLERDLHETKETLRQTQKVIDYVDDKTKQDAAFAKAVTDRLDRVDTRMGALAKADPKVAAWATAPVPESVRQLRREAFPGTAEVGRVRDPVKPAAANPGAAAERSNQQRPEVGSGPVAKATTDLQPGKEQRPGNAEAAKPTPQSITDRIDKIRKGLKP